jgi:anti-sigma B factor antagonist
MSLLQTAASGSILTITVVPKRLDAKIAVEFKDKMTELINAGNHNIILDLSNVDFVDSSGLGAIVTSLKILGRRGDLVVAGVKNDVMTMFTLTRMDRVFRMFPTTADAQQALAGS